MTVASWAWTSLTILYRMANRPAYLNFPSTESLTTIHITSPKRLALCPLLTQYSKSTKPNLTAHSRKEACSFSPCIHISPGIVRELYS